MRWRAAAALALAGSLTAFAQAQQAVPCADAPAVLTGGSARGQALACDGVKDAFRFLAPLGLSQPVQVPIRLVETLPPTCGPTPPAATCIERAPCTC